METLFSFTASRFTVAIFVIFSIVNQGLVNAAITNGNQKIQASLDPNDSGMDTDLRNIIDSILADDPDDDQDQVSMPAPVMQKPSQQVVVPTKESIAAAKKETPPTNMTRAKLNLPLNEILSVIKQSSTTASEEVGEARRSSNRNFDFEITSGVSVTLFATIISLYIIQWMVSVLMPIKSPNPVPWLRETASDVARGAVPGIIASSARPSRDAKFKLWQNSLSALMMQAFVVGPFALLAVAVGHYADSPDDGLDVDVSTFMVVFGACAAISLIFFFVVAASMICAACCKIGTWQRNEMLCSTPDQVVRRYANAIAEQQLHPPKCTDICKQEDIQVAIDRMHYLFLRTQVVPFRDLEPESNGNAWIEPFFPSKHEFKDRVAHFDLAQYLTVKLSFVLSEMFFVKHWVWLLSGPIFFLVFGVQWMLNKSKLSSQMQIDFEYLEFLLFSFILGWVVVIIHLKLYCIKRHRFKQGLQDVNDAIKKILPAASDDDDSKDKEELLDWEASGKDIMKSFIRASQNVHPPMTKGCEDKMWFGDPGRMCGHNWLKYMLQLTLVFSSILMSIFFWHIVPLLLVKYGPAVLVVVLILMFSGWITLVLWVPNVVFNLVLLGHCGPHSFDPTVIAKIETEGRARLEVGAETVFDCIFLNKLEALKDMPVKTNEPESKKLIAQAEQRFECLKLKGSSTMNTETFAKWFNANMLRGPITFSQDIIMDKLGVETGSFLDVKQFAVLYVKSIQTFQALRMDFCAFQDATKEVFLGKFSDMGSNVSAQVFYELINTCIRVPEGYKQLSTMQRVANENAFLAVAELFDVADVNSFGDCDVNMLIMVTKMYLPDF